MLTHYLTANGKPSATATDVGDDRIEALARSLQRYFDAPRAPRWAGDPRGEHPDRLVYLLDHQYTRRSLAWHRLKGADAMRAAALCAVAQRLDCEILLALADVHESWSCEDEYETFHRDRRRGWRRHEEDGGDDGDDDASKRFDLFELLDSDVELRHWLPSDGRAEGLSAAVDGDEVCFTKATNELEPLAGRGEKWRRAPRAARRPAGKARRLRISSHI